MWKLVIIIKVLIVNNVRYYAYTHICGCESMGILQNTRLDTAVLLGVSPVICKTAIYSNPISKPLDTLDAIQIYFYFK